MKAQIQILMLLVLPILACDVTEKTVGDAPPQFVHLKKLSGPTFGHIVSTDLQTKEVGTSFSAFEFPQVTVLNEKEYHRFIQRIRRVGSYVDPITETQFQGSSIFAKYSAACGLTRKEPESENEPFSDCNQLLTLNPYKTSYKNCGLKLPKPEQKIGKEDVTEKQCKCLAENGEKLFTAEKALDASITQMTILGLKQNLGRCAWRMVDPPELKKSKLWLFGDDRKRDGTEDAKSSKGSRLSIVDAGGGNVEVKIDFMNFNGVNYTTETYEYGKWAAIRDVEYNMGTHRLSFAIDEMEDYGKPTGRVLEFKLDRMNIFKSIPEFHRFNGDMIIKKRNASTGEVESFHPERKGSAKIDGYLLDKERDMLSVWAAEGVEIPE